MIQRFIEIPQQRLSVQFPVIIITAPPGNPAAVKIVSTAEAVLK